MAKFQKGQSGNPSGRKKMDAAAVEDVRATARQWTSAAIDTLASICQDKGARDSARVAAATALLDRGWGKPTQPVEGADGGPIRIEIDWLTADEANRRCGGE